MSVEIERKFLVRGDTWREAVTRRVHIRQAYLSSGGNASVRVRIKDTQSATLTVKSSPAVRRLELEYAIPVPDAEALLELRTGAVLDKVRHIVPVGDLTFEVDVFEGENEGLIVAEVELSDAGQQVHLPDWIGVEVTGQAAYYNSELVRHPFKAWPQGGAAIAPE